MTNQYLNCFNHACSYNYQNIVDIFYNYYHLGLVVSIYIEQKHETSILQIAK